jgi:hypothetical protein
MKIDLITILVVMCCCSCSSSSSSAAVFFTGLIPRTGPHFMKVTGLNDLKGQGSFLLDVVKKRVEPLKTENEKKIELEKIRESNPNEVATFCATAKKVRDGRTKPPYNQPGGIVTIGGMKNPVVVAAEGLPTGLVLSDIEFPAKIFCGM